MRVQWTTFDEHDRAAFRATIAFLDGRLEERATIDWALRLKEDDRIKRLALLDLIDSPNGRSIGEPWRSAWRLVEESWNNPTVEDRVSTGTYDVQQRLRAGDRSGSLVAAIVNLVAPRLKVEMFSDSYLRFRRPPRRPKKVEDLFSTRLTSQIVDPGVLEIGELTDRSFLLALASALDAAVASGLDIARRIGWDGERHLWQLGQLHRVYYVPTAEHADGEDEPDRFHRGIAPVVKLLHTVVSRLAVVDISGAIEFVRRWKVTNSPVHLRLWAALARDPRVVPANEVGALLLSLDQRRFWNLHDYPEIAELRAKRFSELDVHEQTTITARIRKRPPRNQWPKNVEADRVEEARLYWALRELRRIEIGGGALPQRDKAWLDSRISQFADLVQMVRPYEGFMGSPKARSVPPNPDSRYDLLAGGERLKALEDALSSTRGGWDDDPAGRATDWIRQQGNPSKVLADLESTQDGGPTFAGVWNRFGWAHSPTAGQGEEVAQRDLLAEADRVLTLLAKLPEATARQAIDGLSNWLSSWEKQVVVLAQGLVVWLKLWPIAVEATNAQRRVEEEIDLNTVARPSDDREPMDLDTLNTPAGKLVGVFLMACPTVQPGEQPFQEGNSQRLMRNAIEAALGTAGLIVKYRLIEQMPYFLAADAAWTRTNLVPPLLTDTDEARTLWRAVASQSLSFKVMAILGNAMADRAVDLRLGRDTRRSLVFRIVVECLHAFKDRREPAIPYPRIEQMIRSLDDEVRASGADAIQRFVRDVSAIAQGSPPSPTPEILLRTAAAPFLQQVWPKERSLATPGVSRALAGLPAATKGAFAEAVNAIERFLVPFDCWSMLDYGLYREEGGEAKLSSIDNREKAAALLRLLDHTIGKSEASVIPHDLADALDQVRKVAADLAETQIFRRLATAARRS